ncbi:MAG: anthranilate phosphoribosyltransferase [Dehalococcoidia bacterium]|nr:Anthranilate phosphoribosyltransferase [Chloroflexota bacterium]MBT9159293.1 Anthranilate phosphoribosyltransferase [Chloroflexota bacterium]MBT9161484.1 Anthranilate phosphoribosyltransferase [Chloroflexota bacterium]
MIKEAIARIVEGSDLTIAEAAKVMAEIMQGKATPAQLGAFITALRIKGETAAEIAGCARIMRENAIRVKPQRADLVDTCGTGGDGSGTFNISTTVAFVAAGAGLGVAKHGNRSVSSRCGSADLMQALGVRIDLSPVQVAHCIDEVGIGFLFAPALHPAMKYAAAVRQEIGLRTIFNLLGPLANPARVRRQLLGVYSAHLTVTLAEVLHAMGSEHAFVVHGADGLDELSTTGINRVSELRFDPLGQASCPSNGQVRTYDLDPQELGLPPARLSDLAGGDLEENAEITREVLAGQKGPRRDVVLLNAAAVLTVGGKARDLREGLAQAAQSIDSGKALEKISELVEMTCSFHSRYEGG